MFNSSPYWKTIHCDTSCRSICCPFHHVNHLEEIVFDKAEQEMIISLWRKARPARRTAPAGGAPLPSPLDSLQEAYVPGAGARKAEGSEVFDLGLLDPLALGLSDVVRPEERTKVPVKPAPPLKGILKRAHPDKPANPPSKASSDPLGFEKRLKESTLTGEYDPEKAPKRPKLNEPGGAPPLAPKTAPAIPPPSSLPKPAPAAAPKPSPSPKPPQPPAKTSTTAAKVPPGPSRAIKPTTTTTPSSQPPKPAPKTLKAAPKTHIIKLPTPKTVSPLVRTRTTVNSIPISKPAPTTTIAKPPASACPPKQPNPVLSSPCARAEETKPETKSSVISIDTSSGESESGSSGSEESGSEEESSSEEQAEDKKKTEETPKEKIVPTPNALKAKRLEAMSENLVSLEYPVVGYIHNGKVPRNTRQSMADEFFKQYKLLFPNQTVKAVTTTLLVEKELYNQSSNPASYRLLCGQKLKLLNQRIKESSPG